MGNLLDGTRASTSLASDLQMRSPAPSQPMDPCLQLLTVRRSMPPRAPSSEEAQARLLERSALKPAQRFDSADYFLSKWHESQRVQSVLAEARSALAQRRIAHASSRQRQPHDATGASPKKPPIKGAQP